MSIHSCNTQQTAAANTVGWRKPWFEAFCYPGQGFLAVSLGKKDPPLRRKRRICSIPPSASNRSDLVNNIKKVKRPGPHEMSPLGFGRASALISKLAEGSRRDRHNRGS